MRAKEKALPAHINAIIEQYKSSSVKPVLSHQTTGLQYSTMVKRRAVNNNHPCITRAFPELGKRPTQKITHSHEIFLPHPKADTLETFYFQLVYTQNHDDVILFVMLCMATTLQK